MQSFPKEIIHKKQKHLYRLNSLGIRNLDEKSYIHVPAEDEEFVDNLLKNNHIPDPIVVINAGSKSHLKRWTADSFAELADRLIKECGVSIIFIGLDADKDIVASVMKKMTHPAHNFVNKTNIRQLAGLLKKVKLLITNDSAPLHLDARRREGAGNIRSYGSKKIRPDRRIRYGYK